MQADRYAEVSSSAIGRRDLPTSEQCFIRERRATFLAVFFGLFGADHFYTRSWVRASFKIITIGGAIIWWFVDIILWIFGVYGTPGCLPSRKTKGACAGQ
jgi:TM2 domain-containing membrane protein YozV